MIFNSSFIQIIQFLLSDFTIDRLWADLTADSTPPTAYESIYWPRDSLASPTGDYESLGELLRYPQLLHVSPAPSILGYFESYPPSSIPVHTLGSLHLGHLD